MNPEIDNQMSDPVATSPALRPPHPVNQVTTVSKYLALALFIFLPFLGGYVGYVYAPEKVIYHVTPTILISDGLDVAVSTTSRSVNDKTMDKMDNSAGQYAEGEAYGEFTLTNYSTTTTDRVDQYNAAHTLIFEGELLIQAEIVTGTMISPFLLISEAGKNSLPPDFFVGNIDSYSQVFVDPAIGSLVNILNDAELNSDKKYVIETTVTGLVFRKGVPKADSISITKISGEPEILSIE